MNAATHRVDVDGHVSTNLDELEWAVERADRERAVVCRRAELTIALAEAAVTAKAAVSRLGDAWSDLASTARELGRVRGHGR